MFKKAAFINFAVVLLVSLGLAFWTLVAWSDKEMTQDYAWLEEPSQVQSPHGDQLVSVEADFTYDLDRESAALTVDLKQGALWLATLAGELKASVDVGFARVESEGALAYVQLEDDRLQVYSLLHPVRVVFVNEGQDLNELWVPTGHRMSIEAAQVTSTLSKLRLTKLIKEFPVFSWELSELSGLAQEVEEGIDRVYADRQAGQELYLASLAEPRAVAGFASSVQERWFRFRGAVTLLSHAEQSLENESRDDVFARLLYSLLNEDKSASRLLLVRWMNYEHSVEDLQELQNGLFYTLPGDTFYSLKQASTELLSTQDSGLERLRLEFHDIESLLKSARLVEASSAYQRYAQSFQSDLGAGRFDDLIYLEDISREYLLLERLLRGNSIFYKVSDLQLLSSLEDKILTLSPSGQDLDEERLAFVQSRLRFLANLFDFVEQGRVTPQEAAAVASDLLFSAEAYLGDTSSEVAVQSFFKSELEKYQVLTQFIRSPEFNSLAEFDDAFAEFEKKLQNLDELSEYLQNVRVGEGTEFSELSLEDATAQVEAALRRNGLQVARILHLGDAGNRLFELQGARLAGYALEANYDRETQILYELHVEGLSFASGLSLSSAEAVIEQAFSDSSGSNEPDLDIQTNEVFSPAERVALDRAESTLIDLGFHEDLELEISDLERDLFHFEALYEEHSIMVQGTLDLAGQRLSDLIFELDDVSYPLPNISLKSFGVALEATVGGLK